jgi:N-acylethanolamine-hydrolysing acid amidase
MINFYTNMVLVYKGYSPVSFVARDSLTYCKNFTCAKNMLAEQKLGAGVYYIMAGVGPDEGIIMTRDRGSVADITDIINANYLVQTNEDHFTG